MYSYNNSQEQDDHPPPMLANGQRRAASVPRPLQTPPSTVHKADIFFSNTEHGGLHRSRTAPAPLPPKPYSYASSPPPVPPLPSAPPLLPPPPSVPRETRPVTSENDDLQAAIEISKSESAKRAEYLDSLSSQEEEDLARALQESLRLSASTVSQPQSAPLPLHAPPPSRPSGSRSPKPAHSAPVSRSSSSRKHTGSLGSSPNQSTHSVLNDEALARQLAEEEEENERLRNSGERDGRLPNMPSIDEDEALARRLAAEEEEREATKADEAVPAITTTSFPPNYTESVSTPSQNGSDVSSLLSTSSSGIHSASTTSSFTTTNDTLTLSPQRRPLSADHATSSSNVLNVSNTSTRHSTVSLPSLSEDGEDNNNTPGPPLANQFVDSELLVGFSIGFVAPVISHHQVPWQGVMPNIISLPHGKCPPLHLQAPSWRHLLKLMARLSGTKVEPSIESIANKVNPILRTVVQVVRPHHTASDWRTVVWFTIDHPAPKNAPRKYLNGDVDALPYSYSLIPNLPALLQDSADTAISKTYTIPSTENVPYPVLPISFPNLALYLTAALEEARRYMNDSSSGIRKLAKMIDTCYPSEASQPSSTGRTRNLLGRVMGRGNKNKNNRGRGGNEETYELVTPFVPDEWG